MMRYYVEVWDSTAGKWGAWVSQPGVRKGPWSKWGLRRLDLTRERIRQIQAKALEVLRQTPEIERALRA
jgi:hypothetical protein